ncbi:poly-beta-1,6-N-acetyl-D-glucosamine synthase [Castellaniella caeni]|uniref:poly-beta-1,6-N-acetyl-D-glucosamine synthase n=1 Tax=Castellaniella caeni TaxID=266123 RepID=UPI000C9FE8D5|nr:poly-beta-1,6-N-acetyl-D-glucosamine synthase [Castellaniella caeni]
MTSRPLAGACLCLSIGAPLGIAAVWSADALLGFAFFYPLLIAVVSILGGLYYWFHWERHWAWGLDVQPPELKGNPLITILISCHNQAEQGPDTVLSALDQHYLNIEVIAIDDGSTDGTGRRLDALAAVHERLRVVHLDRHQGKAMALRMGALAARSDYLVCIDGDALLDRNAASFLVAPLLACPRVGAVTGNPRIRTRSTLIGRIQVGECASIAGLIKRTQRVYGQVFTVSGVVSAFRRSALDRVGYWSLDTVAEDIDISWKLQRDHWSIFYEPRALCWIPMPETIRGLWRQRLRRAQGGAEVFLSNVPAIWSWRYRRLWPMVLEYGVSSVWAFALLLAVVLWTIGLFTALPSRLHIDTPLPPAFTGMVLVMACLLQFALSIFIDQRYEHGLARSLYWAVWYPLAYWVVHLLTTLCSFPAVLLKRRRPRARRESPDRGIKAPTS